VPAVLIEAVEPGETVGLDGTVGLTEAVGPAESLELGAAPLAVAVGGAELGWATGAVLLYRLMMAWLPVCASPMGTPMHGGGVMCTPLCPPWLPV
jgi:hypothetical protein